jgi:DNA repair exonuclease SbcCD ATPase subunit
MDLKNFRTILERRKGAQVELQRQVADTERALKALEQEIADTEDARAILQTVAQATQQELEYQISEVATLALSAIFDEPYSLKVDFVIARGKTEAKLKFERDGEAFDPMDDTGGGAVDVAAFALRVALWTLRNPRRRAVLILDEPFKHLDTSRQERASHALAEISKGLGLQIIMVSHSDALIEGADKVFQVTQQKGISEVKEK